MVRQEMREPVETKIDRGGANAAYEAHTMEMGCSHLTRFQAAQIAYDLQPANKTP
jgi:hypothetical protein